MDDEIIIYLATLCIEGFFSFLADRLERYLSVYKAEGGPVPESQWDLMAPLLRYLKFIEVTFYLHNSIIGDVWDPDYGLENIRALINLEGVKLV